MSTPTQVPSFNTIARDLDPMMPKEQFDALRTQYFDTHVAPKVPSNFSVMATREQFMKATERQPLLSAWQARKAQATLAATSFAKPIAKGAAGAVDIAKRAANFVTGDLTAQATPNVSGQMEKDFTAAQDRISRGLARDGYDVLPARLGGEIAGDLTAFVPIQVATDGAAGLAESLGDISSATKGLELALKTAKGGAAFGTYEALQADGHDRGYAFAKGAAVGAAFDGSITLAGQLLRRAGVQPEDVEREVAETMQANPSKPLDKAVDSTLAQHVEQTQVRAKAEGKPLLVKQDDTLRKVRVLGTEASGQPFTIQVDPDAEGKAIEALSGKLKAGGGVDAVLYHSNEVAAFNRFSKMANDMDVLPKTETRVVTTAPRKAKVVAAQMNAEGIKAEPVADDKVHVEVPKPRPPSIGSITSELSTHELPDGTRLQKGEVWDYAKKIQQLWNPQVPSTSKEIIARGLVGKDFERLIPQEWQRTVEEAGEVEPEIIGDETPEHSSIEESMRDEIEAKSRGVTPAGLLEGQNVEGSRQLPQGFSVEERVPVTAREKLAQAHDLFDKGATIEDVQRSMGVSYAKAKTYYTKWSGTSDRLAIPPSERTQLSYDRKGTPITVKIGRSKTTVQLPPSAMEEAYPGARAFVDRSMTYKDILSEIGIDVEGPEQRPGSPTMVFSQPEREVVYHEGLHVQLNALGDEKFADLVANDTAHDIARGLRTHPVYSGMPYSDRLEEAYVHAATAVRLGDKDALDTLARYDRSVPDVVSMVDETSRGILTRLPAKLDTETTRAFEERMRNLLRRTGRDRAERWTDDADRAGKTLFYDADRDSFVLSEASQQLAIDSKGSVADALEQAQGAAEYVPSETIGFEMRGLRNAFAPLRGVPYSEKNMPMPEFTPNEDRFRGITAASALVRPTQDWAATIDKKFAQTDRDLKFFDKWKAVDDAVRSGENWLFKSYNEAASFLRGDPNRLKTMFEFLNADPRHWQDMIPRFGMSADKTFLDDVTKANKWLSDFRDSTGIQVFNYLRNDLQRLRGFDFDTSYVYGRGIKDPKDMSFFHKAISEGDLNPRDAHAGRFINFLLRAGYEKKFTGPALDDLNKLLQLKDKAGNSVLGTDRFAVQNYVNHVKGIPDASQQIITKTVGDFQKILGGVFKNINTRLPKKYHLPEEFNYPGSVVNKLMNVSYAANIGARPIIAVRDVMQVFTNALPVLGPAKFARGLAKALTSGGWREAREAGAQLSRHTVGELYGDIFQEIPPHSGGKLDQAFELSNKLLAPSRWGHNIGRSVVYHGEYDSALNAVRDYTNGKIDVRKLFTQTSMKFFPKPLQTNIMRDVMAIKGGGKSAQEVAKRIALEAVDSTLWAYRRGTQPMALRTGLGRIFGQYGLWPLNFFEYARRMATMYGSYPEEAMKSTGLWLGMNYAASTALSSTGADVSKWFFLSPTGYSGSPNLEFVQDLMKAPEESQDGREARKRVLDYPLNFIPASLEIENVLKALESGEPIFNSDGTMTDSALRVLGLKPKQKSAPPSGFEDRLRYEAGFGKGDRTQ